MTTPDAAPSALIIGASRGIGLRLARALLDRGWRVTATVRDASKTSELMDYRDRVTLDTVDINDIAAVEAFVSRVRGEMYDVVLVNAGVGGPDGKTAETATPAEVTHLFMSNAVSPVRIAGKLLDNVKAETGILAFMSSVLGSVATERGAEMQLYSASKAALNQLTRRFTAGMTRPVTVLNLHPGWVKTDMGGPHADIDVATSARGLADVLESKAGAGGQIFLDYRGEVLAW